ncbi:hypothetical protein F511_14209 [Dorcoceras hygrometricum]|uniref:Uncharacterized protein n=1 Tax=Dorcoceras hygrometricum TaxID=472368 RepID=A0A2Z7CTY2_9LAMI|nr:hypothetical protein F511_14209 [Dorcoceras hygrometricum]
MELGSCIAKLASRGSIHNKSRLGLKETGIDQVALHSVQLGYLKILQMGNTDPNNIKAGKEIRGQASVRRAIKTANHPVSPSQLGGRHSNPIVTTPMIALDFSGTTHQSASHNVAFNQNIKLNQYNKLIHVIHIIKSADFITSITAMSTLKAVKSAQFVPSSLKYLNRFLTSINNKGKAQNQEELLPRSSKLTDEQPDQISQESSNEQQLCASSSSRSTASNKKPAVALNKNQQQPTDIAFAKEHQNDVASTNQNDAVALQHLTTDFFPNNQQLVALNNSKKRVKDTSPLLPTADQKRCTQNDAF